MTAILAMPAISSVTFESENHGMRCHLPVWNIKPLDDRCSFRFQTSDVPFWKFYGWGQLLHPTETKIPVRPGELLRNLTFSDGHSALSFHLASIADFYCYCDFPHVLCRDYCNFAASMRIKYVEIAIRTHEYQQVDFGKFN